MAKTTSIHASLTEDQLHNWKLLEAFQRELEPRLAQAAASEPSAPDRQLTPGAYLSMTLFGLLNSALKSARALCAASQFKRMQEEVSGEPVKLTSFSEMQHVCDPELLAGLLRDLSTRALPVFGEDRLRAQVQELIVNDRNYSHDYALIHTVQQSEASFVLRLHNNTVLHPLAPPRALSEADRAAGVTQDVRVRLGAGSDGPVGRLVRMEINDHVFLLFTDREDLEADLVTLIYKYRWQIELFEGLRPFTHAFHVGVRNTSREFK